MKNFLFGAACGALSVLFPKAAGVVVLCLIGLAFILFVLFIIFTARCVSGDPANKGND